MNLEDCFTADELQKIKSTLERCYKEALDVLFIESAFLCTDTPPQMPTAEEFSDRFFNVIKLVENS